VQLTVRVRLRPIEAGDVEWLVAMAADPRAVGEHNWTGDVDESRTRATLVERVGAPVELAGGQLVVESSDGTPIGDVSWRSERWGPSAGSVCPAIGIALLPDHRGQGLGTDAQRLLVELLFRLGTHRVQSDTAVDNVAEQHALEKAGFRREGVVRDAEFRSGRYHDHVLYGIVRTDWVRDESMNAGLPSI
jgi:RimJ/RimL family protein N-acetyltransferase